MPSKILRQDREIADACPACGPKRPSSLVPGREGDEGRGWMCDACNHVARRGAPICACGAVMIARWQNERYCSRCEKPGMASVVLVAPDGRERMTWHPAEQVRQLAVAAKRDPKALVFDVDERNWRVGRLPRSSDLSAQVSLWEGDCADCGQPLRRPKLGPRRPRFCLPCVNRRKVRCREGKATYYNRRWRSKVHKCTGCGRTAWLANKARGWCQGCAKRAAVHGVCSTHDLPLFRGDRWSPARCTECVPSVIRKKRQVLIRVVDGRGRDERIWIGENAQLDGACAGSYAGPVVLVDRIDGQRMIEAKVISGLRLPGTGPVSRAVLPGLVRGIRGASLIDWLADQLGDRQSAQATKMRLSRAGLIDEQGAPTERARAVVRWAQAAGVRL